MVAALEIKTATELISMWRVFVNGSISHPMTTDQSTSYLFLKVLNKSLYVFDIGHFDISVCRITRLKQ